MAYNYGNLAVQPKRQRQEDYVIRETRKKVVISKSIPVKEKLLYLMTVLLIVVVASVIIFRYADIYNTSLNIKGLNNDLQTMELEIQQLQREVETLNNPERIRQFAESQGMASSLEPGIVLNKNAGTDKTAMLE